MGVQYVVQGCQGVTSYVFYEFTTTMSLNNNTYATKKTIAQGMLDIALLTANASQLRYILQVGPDNHDFYTPMLVMLITSMSLQALNGLAQLIMGPLDIDKDEHKSFLNVVNYASVVSSYGIIAIDVIKMAIGLGDPVI